MAFLNNDSDEWCKLNPEDLETIAGGAGGSSESVEADGTVTGVLQNGVFQVNVNQQTVTATLSGKMRMNFIRVLVGDRVRVQYSPDAMKGRITYRYK